MLEKSHTGNWWPNLYEPLRNIGQKVADWVTPRSEASALEDTYEINVELPGIKNEDLDVSVHDNSIIVRGEKHFEREETGRTYYFSEREYGTFQRTFQLPADADGDKIDAEFSDGVLCLKIHKKAQSKASGKKINVQKA